MTHKYDDYVEMIERECEPYQVALQYGRGTNHPYVNIVCQDGRHRKLIFCQSSRDFRSVLNCRSDLRRLLRDLAPPLRPDRKFNPRRDGALGDVIAEAAKVAIAAPLPPCPDAIRAETPPTPPKEIEPVTKQPELKLVDAKTPKSSLTQSEVIKVTRTIVTNAEIDDAQKIVLYHDGWSDKRVGDILRSTPGREHLKDDTIAAIRRRDFGLLIEEKQAEENLAEKSPGPFSVKINSRLDKIEDRVARLEARLGIKIETAE